MNIILLLLVITELVKNVIKILFLNPDFLSIFISDADTNTDIPDICRGKSRP